MTIGSDDSPPRIVSKKETIKNLGKDFKNLVKENNNNYQDDEFEAVQFIKP